MKQLEQSQESYDTALKSYEDGELLLVDLERAQLNLKKKLAIAILQTGMVCGSSGTRWPIRAGLKTWAWGEPIVIKNDPEVCWVKRNCMLKMVPVLLAVTLVLSGIALAGGE